MEKVSQRKITKRVNKKIDTDYHNVESLIFVNDSMILKVDGNVYSYILKNISEKLLKASNQEREAYRIICSGYGISWPLIDEDLSINGLIKANKTQK